MLSVFEQARRQVPLSAFLVAAGARLRSSSSGLRSSLCPACGPATTNEWALSVREPYFRCFKCAAKGDVTCAAARIWKRKEDEAARLLVEFADRFAAIETVAPIATSGAALNGVFAKLLESRHVDPTVLAWATTILALPHDLVEEAMQRDMLRMLPAYPEAATAYLADLCGRDLLQAAGLWLPGKAVPAAAFRPLVFLMPGSAEFHLARKADDSEPHVLRYGRAKQPWVWHGQTGEWSVVASAIDMLSLVALGYKGSVIALPGMGSWRHEWLQMACERQRQPVHVALDGSESGRRAAEAIAKAIQAAGGRALLHLQPPGSSVNTRLVERVGAELFG